MGLSAFLDECIDITYFGVKARIPALGVDGERRFDPSTAYVRRSPKEVAQAFVTILNSALQEVS